MRESTIRKGWTKHSFSDLFRIKHGYAFKGQYFADNGDYVVLTPGNFYEKGGFKLKEKEKYYLGPVPEGYILRQGDLIVAMTEQAEGLLGSSAIIPESNYYLHNQRLGLIVDLDEKKLVKGFLYYLFNTPPVRDQIRATANGAKVRHTSPSRIYAVQVELPHIDVQERIVRFLSLYDDLINNNARRVHILEQIVHDLYQEWFVHFRFPGRNELQEITAIPSGWEIQRLAEFCHLVMGQSPKSVFYNTTGDGLPFHQGVTFFGERFPDHTVYCTAENRIAETGDILFSVRAPVGRMNLANKRIIIGRGLSAIRSKQGYQAFLFEQLRQIFHEEDMIGGGTIFQAVTKTDMQRIDLLIPSSSLIEKFEELVEPIFKLIQNLTNKNNILQQSRDLLLPRLIAGETDISNLDIEIGEQSVRQLQ